MSKPITYGQLRKLLRQLGFDEKVVSGSHVVYDYSEPKTRLVYREYGPDEMLDGTDVLKTRRYLDEWGLVEEKAFERLLQETAA